MWSESLSKKGTCDLAKAKAQNETESTRKKNQEFQFNTTKQNRHFDKDEGEDGTD